MDDAGSPAQLTKPTQSKSGAHRGRVRQCGDKQGNRHAEHREWLDSAKASGGLLLVQRRKFTYCFLFVISGDGEQYI